MHNYKKNISIHNVVHDPDYSQGQPKESIFSNRKVSYLVPDSDSSPSCNNYSRRSSGPGFPPPPAPNGREDLWELQFCRWWGWNWVRKRDSKEFRGSSGEGEGLPPKGLKKMQKRWKEFNKELQKLRKQEGRSCKDVQTSNLPTKEQFKELCKCFFRPPPHQKTYCVEEDVFRTPSHSVTTMKNKRFRKKSSLKNLSPMTDWSPEMMDDWQPPRTSFKDNGIQVTDSDENPHQLMRSSTDSALQAMIEAAQCNNGNQMRNSFEYPWAISGENPRQSIRQSMPRQSMMESTQATRASGVNPRQSMRQSMARQSMMESTQCTTCENNDNQMWNSNENPPLATRTSGVNPRQSMRQSMPRQSMMESTEATRTSGVNPRQSMRESMRQSMMESTQPERNSDENLRQSMMESTQCTTCKNNGNQKRNSIENPPEVMTESNTRRKSSAKKPLESMSEWHQCTTCQNNGKRKKSSDEKHFQPMMGWAPYTKGRDDSICVDTSDERFPEPMGDRPPCTTCNNNTHGHPQMEWPSCATCKNMEYARMKKKEPKRKAKSCRTRVPDYEPQTCTSEEIPHRNFFSDRDTSSTEESIEYLALRVSSFRSDIYCPCHGNKQNGKTKRDLLDAQTSTFVFPLKDEDTQTSGKEKDRCTPCHNDEKYIKIGKKRKVICICVCCCSCGKQNAQSAEPTEPPPSLLQQGSALLKDIPPGLLEQKYVVQNKTKFKGITKSKEKFQQSFDGRSKSPSSEETTKNTTTYNFMIPPISTKAFSKFGTPSKNYSWIQNIGSDTTTTSLNFPQTYKSPNSGKTYDFTSWNFNDRPNLTLPDPIDVSEDVTYLKQLQSIRKSSKEDRMLLDAVCDAILSEHELKFGNESDFDGRNPETVVNNLNNAIRPKFERRRPRMRIPKVPKIDNVFDKLIHQVLKSDVEVYSSDEMYNNYEPVLNKLRSFSVLASAYEHETNSLPSRKRKKKRRALQELNNENSCKKMKQDMSTQIVPSRIPQLQDFRTNSCVVNSRINEALSSNVKLEDIVAKIEEMMKRAQATKDLLTEPCTANKVNKRSYQMSSDVFTRTVSFTEQAGSMKKSYELFSNRKDPIFETFPNLAVSSLVVPQDNDNCSTEEITPNVISAESLTLNDTKLSVQNFTVCDVTSSQSQKNVSVDEGHEKEPPMKKKNNSHSLIPIRRRNF